MNFAARRGAARCFSVIAVRPQSSIQAVARDRRELEFIEESEKLAPNLWVSAPELLSSSEYDEDLFDYGVVNKPVAKVQAFGSPGEVTREISLNPDVFGGAVRPDIMHRVVLWQRARWRQGTAKVKNIRERSGTGRKPHPQKGLGKARQGSKRAPHMIGGGRVHGPLGLRDWSHKLPKRIRKMGLRSALSAKYQEGNLFVVENFDLEQPNVREFLSKMKGHGWTSGALLVDGVKSPDSVLKEALSNISRNTFQLVPQVGCSVYGVLKHQRLVLSLEALESLEGRLQNLATERKRESLDAYVSSH